jgi:hypothetical protein
LTTRTATAISDVTDDLQLFDLVAPSNHLLSVSDRHVPSHREVLVAFKRRGAADATPFHDLTPAFFPVLGTDALPKTLVVLQFK